MMKSYKTDLISMDFCIYVVSVRKFYISEP